VRDTAAAADASPAEAPPAKRLKTLGAPLRPGIIRPSLLAPESAERLRAAHDASGPYTHVVLEDLADPDLLRSVRDEVINNVQATYKETDLFKVFQTGRLRARPWGNRGIEGRGRGREHGFGCRVLERQRGRHKRSEQGPRGWKCGVVGAAAAVVVVAETLTTLRHLRVAFPPNPPNHATGDLANLDELDPASAAKLPSLMRLRDALYSQEFRA
jgi:hypothetical protein